MNSFRPNTLRNSNFSEPFLSKYRKQKLSGVSNTHLLNEVGSYHGTQYEKSVYESDGTGKIISAHITNQVIVSSKGTATITVVVGELQIGIGWVSEIELSDGTIYLCEERTGTTSFDSSGNGNHGSLIGIITHTTKRNPSLINYTNQYGYTLDGNVIIPRVLGTTLDAQGNVCEFIGKVASDLKMVQSNCLYFNGTDGRVLYEKVGGIIDQVYTCFCRIKVDTIGGLRRCIYESKGSYEISVDIDASTGFFRAFCDTVNGLGVVISNVLAEDGKEYSISSSYGDGFLKLYINGIKVGESARSQALVGTETGIFFGTYRSQNDRFFKGWIYDAQLYKSVLSDADQLKLHNQESISVIPDWEFDMAEGTGTTCYSREDKTKTLSLIGGVTWSTQDIYHANITKGFSDNNDGVKRPYKINGVYTNPATKGHNGAETNLQMEVFREDLADSELHYEQSNYTPNIIKYEDIIEDLNKELFHTNTKEVGKINIETFIPGNKIFKIKRYKHGFHKNINTL